MGEKISKLYDSVKLKDPIINIKKIIECENKRLLALTSNYLVVYHT